MMGTDESSKLLDASKTAGQKTLSYTFMICECYSSTKVCVP